jgi:hypothetical protein
MLYPQPVDNNRISALCNVLKHAHSRARMTCFWRGDPGEAEPPIPAEFHSAIVKLEAEIETDFAAAETAR